MHRLICFVAATLLLNARFASAAVVSFSGGSGGPVTVTIAAPISYTATAADPGLFSFVFKGAGNPFHNSDPDAVGTLTYSINGGAAQPLNFANSGFVGGSWVANDIYIANASLVVGIAAGDVVTLSAGMLTTTTNFADPAPSGGNFTTYLYSYAGGGEVSNSQISNAGVQVPEPSMLCGLGVVSWLAFARHRRSSRRI